MNLSSGLNLKWQHDGNGDAREPIPMNGIFLKMTTKPGLEMKIREEMFRRENRLEVLEVWEEDAKTNLVIILSFKYKTRPFLDRFQDSSKTGSGINFFATFLAAFFGPDFWRAFLSMQYKSLMPFLGGGGGGLCRSLSWDSMLLSKM